MKIAVVGCGNVGFNTMKVFALLGHEVVGFDTLDSARERIQEEFGERAVAGTIDDLISAEVCFVCVPTEPSPTAHRADLTIVESVAEQIAILEKSRDCKLRLFVQRSTCPPGTADKLSRNFHNVGYCVSPSFLSKATAWEDSIRPPRIVYSGNVEVQTLMAEIHEAFDSGVPRFTPSDHRSAELLKYIENTMDGVLISLWNEYLAYADHLEIPRNAFVELMRAVARRGRFRSTARVPGGAFGLWCLPKDLGAFQSELQDAGVPHGVLHGAMETNERLRKTKGTNERSSAELLEDAGGLLLPSEVAIAQLTAETVYRGPEE